MTTATVQHGNTIMAAYLNLWKYCGVSGITVRKLEWVKGRPELVIINDGQFFNIGNCTEITPGYYMSKSFVRHHKEFLATAFRCTVKSICPSSVCGRFMPVPQMQDSPVSVKELI